MRLLHVTNTLSLHQIPIANEFVKLLGGDNYRYAVKIMPGKDRIAMGWDNFIQEPWLLWPEKNLEDKSIYDDWWQNADVVICGERDLEKISSRLKDKKFTFYMSERWWKPPMGAFRLLNINFFKMAYHFHKLSKSHYFYYLAIGSFAKSDINKIAFFKNRILQWGYFTSTKSNCNRPTTSNFSILWAGRMLKWKNVDTIIRAFANLNKQFPETKLTLVGDGVERKSLERLAAKKLMKGSYVFLPTMTGDKVRCLMENHSVYILASNAYEGWGAVVNEAMSEGCAVISSREAGISKVLIENNKNGILFKTRDSKDLTKKLFLLNNDKSLLNEIAVEGQKTVCSLWSPRIAAERFISFSNNLLENTTPISFHEGPMKKL